MDSLEAHDDHEFTPDSDQVGESFEGRLLLKPSSEYQCLLVKKTNEAPEPDDQLMATWSLSDGKFLSVFVVDLDAWDDESARLAAAAVRFGDMH